MPISQSELDAALHDDERRHDALIRANNRYFTASETPAVVRLRARIVALAVEIDLSVPDGRNKSIALTGLEDVQMRANRGIFATGADV